MSDTSITIGPVLITDQQADSDTITVEVGIDPGRGQTHIVGTDPLNPERTIELAFPSWTTTYGFSAAELLRQRQAGPGEWGRFAAHEHIIRFKAELMDTAVGELALVRGELGEPITNGWADPDRYQWLGPRLGLTGIAALYPRAKHITARVCTGVPVRMWSPERSAVIKKAWERTFPLTYKGRDVTIRVTQCVVVAEGHAAWVAMPAERKGGTRLGVDIGAKTVIACRLVDGFVERTYQLDHGVEVVLARLDQHLAASGVRQLTVREHYLLRDAIVAGAERFEIVHRGKPYDVMPAALALFKQAGTQIVRDLAAQVEAEQGGGLDSFAGVDYSGGGVLFMGESIRAEHDARGLGQQVYLAPEPERWTARGYFQQLTTRAATSRRGKRK